MEDIPVPRADDATVGRVAFLVRRCVEQREIYLRELELVVNAGRMDLVDELIAPEYINHSAPPGAPSIA